MGYFLAAVLAVVMFAGWALVRIGARKEREQDAAGGQRDA